MTTDNTTLSETRLLRDLAVESRKITDLTPSPRNARTHSSKQIRQIARSIRQFGWTNPVLIDGEGRIIAGHGRVKAAKLLDVDSVPVIRLEDLTEAQKRAYVIADNKLAANAGWDDEILAIELQFLCDVDCDVDVTLTGFETAEIDLIIESLHQNEDQPGADDLPPTRPSGPPVTRPGDLWLLGNHRLLCGDARAPLIYDQLMGGEKAQMVFADPPYNVAIKSVSGLGAIKHPEFAMASGEMSEGQFTAFLKTIFSNLTRHSMDGSIHYVCMDWRHMGELLNAGKVAYTELKNLCVWNKSNAGMGAFYRSKHELIFVFKNGSAPHINNFELGQLGRTRTNVWDYAGVNTFRNDRLEELAMHPTVKPAALVADAIRDCSHRGGIILDVFTGSGTTLIAAEQTGRRGFGLEIDPGYVDTAIRRWQTRTGGRAVHAETGFAFHELKEHRSSPPNAPSEKTSLQDRDAIPQNMEIYS